MKVEILAQETFVSPRDLPVGATFLMGGIPYMKTSENACSSFRGGYSPLPTFVVEEVTVEAITVKKVMK